MGAPAELPGHRGSRSRPRKPSTHCRNASAGAVSRPGIAFVLLLPGKRQVRRTPVSAARLAVGVRGHLADPALRPLFLAGFVLMGGFVTLYNFIGYRLMQAPFGLSAAVVGLVFLAYLGGTTSAAVAGRVADRFGRRRMFVAAVLLAIAATP